MKNDLIWIAGVSFLVGALLCFITIAATHRHHYEVHQANIGGFIFKGGHIYSLTEMMTDDGEKRGITK